MISAVIIHRRNKWSFISRELILNRMPSRAKIVRLIQITNHTDFAVLNRREKNTGKRDGTVEKMRNNSLGGEFQKSKYRNAPNVHDSCWYPVLIRVKHIILQFTQVSFIELCSIVTRSCLGCQITVHYSTSFNHIPYHSPKQPGQLRAI